MLANLNTTTTPIYVQSVAPSSPVVEQTLWFETGKNILWIYRQSPVLRWESVQTFEYNLPGASVATEQVLWFNPQQAFSDVQIKIERYELAFISPAAQSNTNYWTFSVNTRVNNNTNTVVYSTNTQSATTAVQWFNSIFQSASHLIDASSVEAIRVAATPTGSPGASSFSFKVGYRLIKV